MGGLPFRLPPKLPPDHFRVDFGPGIQLFDNIIRQRGTPITLTPALICPCVRPSTDAGTGHAIPDCEACNGTGFAYDESAKVTISAVVAGVGAQDTHMEDGTYAVGRVHITFPTDASPAEGDRIHLYKTVVTMRASRAYRPVVGGIRLPFVVQGVRTVTILDPRTSHLVPLKEGKDFTLDTNKGLMCFPGDGLVRAGTIVSGVFLATPYYIIDSMVSAFRGQNSRYFSPTGKDEWVKLPQSASAVRADIFRGRFEPDVSVKGSADAGEGS